MNSIEDIKCQDIEGAMYAFPRIFFPKNFIDFAMSKNIQPDLLFCLELLEKKGIVSVPGSGINNLI